MHRRSQRSHVRPGRAGVPRANLRVRATPPGHGDLSHRETLVNASAIISSVAPKRLWYCSLDISSMRRLSAAPPGLLNARRSRFPYLSSMTSHPEAANRASNSSARIPGTTRSSDCRLKSMIHRTLLRRCVSGSPTASQMFPSSSSASPMSETNRPPLDLPNRVDT